MVLMRQKNKLIGRCQAIGNGQKSRPRASVKQVFIGGERINGEQKDYCVFLIDEMNMMQYIMQGNRFGLSTENGTIS